MNKTRTKDEAIMLLKAKMQEIKRLLEKALRMLKGE